MNREEDIFLSIATDKEKKLPFYVDTIGTTEDEVFVCRPRGIECFQLLYTDNGCGTAKLFDKEYTVAEGSLLVLTPNTPHNYYKRSELWRTSWITFGGWAATQFFDVKSGVVQLPEEFGFKEKFKKLLKSRYTLNRPNKSSAGLYALLLECKAVIEEGGATMYGSESRLSECFKYIDRCYGQTITLGELARLCGVSEEHFCRLFKSYTGMRPFDYITKLRIQRAKELLVRSRGMKIGEIAAKTGFGSNSYFSMVFKRGEGCTPEEYRHRITES